MVLKLQGKMLLKMFYINYEECKLIIGEKSFMRGLCFILTMRNVNNAQNTNWFQTDYVLY